MAVIANGDGSHCEVIAIDFSITAGCVGIDCIPYQFCHCGYWPSRRKLADVVAFDLNGEMRLVRHHALRGAAQINIGSADCSRKFKAQYRTPQGPVVSTYYL